MELCLRLLLTVCHFQVIPIAEAGRLVIATHDIAGVSSASGLSSGNKAAAAEDRLLYEQTWLVTLS